VKKKLDKNTLSFNKKRKESKKKRRDSKVPMARFPNIRKPGKIKKAREEMKAVFSSKISLAIRYVRKMQKIPISEM
jgi:hypothetical protein